MFVEADIIVGSKKGLAIPTDALITENNKNFVLLLNNNKNNGYSFKKTAVTIGEKTANLVEIIPDATINSSSKILTKGVFDLIN
jgi:cobalt-zinc-cadmium efflux system membrane fusion protein